MTKTGIQRRQLQRALRRADRRGAPRALAKAVFELSKDPIVVDNALVTAVKLYNAIRKRIVRREQKVIGGWIARGWRPPPGAFWIGKSLRTLLLSRSDQEN